MRRARLLGATGYWALGCREIINRVSCWRAWGSFPPRTETRKQWVCDWSGDLEKRESKGALSNLLCGASALHHGLNIYAFIFVSKEPINAPSELLKSAETKYETDWQLLLSAVWMIVPSGLFSEWDLFMVCEWCWGLLKVFSHFLQPSAPWWSCSTIWIMGIDLSWRQANHAPDASQSTSKDIQKIL